MSPALAAEIDRINLHLFRLTKQNQVSSEVPIRIHTRDTDSGHGLGGPAFSKAFTAFVGQICTCGRKKDPFDPDDYGCSSSSTRFLRGSDHKMHPQRMKRALRKLRAIAPAEHDVLYLMIVLGFEFGAARDKINEGRLRRGQGEYSDLDFLLLAIAGSDKIAIAF